MPKRIGLIKVAISVEGTGTIIGLASDHEWFLDPTQAVHRRERIQIRTPEGKCLSTYIQRMSVLHAAAQPVCTCFILPGDDMALDIPQGSELWLERDEGAEPVLEP
jgi:hypothetical protein